MIKLSGMNKEVLKIGIIGMSPGNAHPYSWSAIINGRYDVNEINKAGFPAVSAYLEANSDTLGIRGALVTHVWTQNPTISESIARTTGIENICTSLTEMASSVDAVILSRDDHENHIDMARPFIDANVPVFIDKPLAGNLRDLKWFKSRIKAGSFIMSCSSMRYSSECRALRAEMDSLGKIGFVTATGKKDWVKYGVHMIEAVSALFDDPVPVYVKGFGDKAKATVHIEYESGLVAVINIFMDISSTFQISVFGQNGWKLIEIRNSYSMFRENITEFIRSVHEGRPRLKFEKTEAIILTLIAGKESIENGSKRIKVLSENLTDQSV